MAGLACFLIAELKLKSLQRKSRINKAYDDKEAMHNQCCILCDLQLITAHQEPGERPLGKMICSRPQCFIYENNSYRRKKPLECSPKRQKESSSDLQRTHGPLILSLKIYISLRNPKSLSHLPRLRPLIQYPALSNFLPYRKRTHQSWFITSGSKQGQHTYLPLKSFL